MTQPTPVDILIVGSGPAGMSTAIHLVQTDPTWAKRIAVVDKAVHPRDKLCGGGVTRMGDDMLTRMGLSFEPAHILVRKAHLIHQDRAFVIRADPIFRITRRDEFDHWLVRHGQRQGVTVYQGEAVHAVTPYPDYVEVVTEAHTFQAKILVAADGSSSFVRRKLKWGEPMQMARLLEILTPEIAEQRFEFRDGVAVLDFSQMPNGLQGYCWDFPSRVKGQPFMNRGVFDSRSHPKRPRVSLKQVLQETLTQRKRNLADYPLKGHPIHCFNPKGSFSRPRVLLVGDAAGVDPLLGEGISFALAYGEVAAAAIVHAFATQDFSLGDYKKRIQAHSTLAQLPVRVWLARVIYWFSSPWIINRFWSVIPLLLGILARYNPYFSAAKLPKATWVEESEST